jgi:hypothetical protein
VREFKKIKEYQEKKIPHSEKEEGHSRTKSRPREFQKPRRGASCIARLRSNRPRSHFIVAPTAHPEMTSPAFSQQKSILCVLAPTAPLQILDIAKGCINTCTRVNKYSTCCGSKNVAAAAEKRNAHIWIRTIASAHLQEF